MTEIWKEIDGTNGQYSVSNLGCVKRNYKKYISHVKEYLNNTIYFPTFQYTRDGYARAKITINGKSNYYLVSRLVATAFIPNPHNKKQVDHINRIKNDNRVENLRWVTNKENCNNKWNNLVIKHNGEIHTVSEWSDITGIEITTILQRLRYGWDAEDSITRPVDISHRHKTYKQKGE